MCINYLSHAGDEIPDKQLRELGCILSQSLRRTHGGVTSVEYISKLRY